MCYKTYLKNFKKPLKNLKKTNLAKVAAHFRITPAAGATKSHILILIEEHCVKHDIIDEVEEKPTAETAEVLFYRKALQDAQIAKA